jgi:hypothetical protein
MEDWSKKFHWMYGIEEYLSFSKHSDLQRYKTIENAVLHGDYWSIRDLIMQEIKRGETGLSEQFANTILMSFLNKDLPDIGNRQMLQYIAHCIDNEFIRDVSSWSIKWGPRANLPDHFSRGQMRSKTWIINELSKIIDNKQLGTVVMYGGWYATVASMLFQKFNIKKFYNLDLDESVMEISKDFNYRYRKSGQFEAVSCDVNQIIYDNNQCKLPNGSLVKPTVVINTSCEHMTEEWFYNLPDGQFVVLQTNNYFSNEQHINCVNNVQEALDKYQFSNVLYAGEIENLLYDRYMIIGIK